MDDFYVEAGGPILEIELALVRIDHEIAEARDHLAWWKACIFQPLIPQQYNRNAKS